jgi:hypothetical protein
MSSPAPTPIWKIALIPALLLVFAGILWKNFSSNTDSDVPELLVPANFTKTRADSSWKVGRKEVAITFNPFRELKPIQPDIAASEINGLLDSPSSEHVANSPSNAEASNSSDPLQALSSQPVTLLIKKGKKLSIRASDSNPAMKFALSTSTAYCYQIRMIRVEKL